MVLLEALLDSSEHTAKGDDYDLLKPWLGDGLLLRYVTLVV